MHHHDALIGVWHLVAAEYREQGGDEAVIPYLGDSPKGMLLYSADGQMSVQVRAH